MPIVISAIPLDYFIKSIKCGGLGGELVDERKFGRHSDHRVIRPRTEWQ